MLDFLVLYKNTMEKELKIILDKLEKGCLNATFCRKYFVFIINFNIITQYYRHFREARKEAYTLKNVKSAFEATGIVPFNPRRVLGKFTGSAAADPKIEVAKGVIIPILDMFKTY